MAAVTRRRVRNPEGQYGTIDPSVGVSSFIPDSPFRQGLQKVAGAVSSSFLSPVRRAAKFSTMGMPEAMKPAAGGLAGTVTGMMTGIPFGGYAGGVAGQALGELAQNDSEGSALGTVAGGLGIASTLSGVRSLVRGGKILFSRKNREQLAQRVMKAPGVRRKQANRLFGRELGKMEGTVDLSEDVAKLHETANATAQGKSLLDAAKRSLSKELGSVLDDPTKATALNATQATELRTAINSIPRLSKQLSYASPEYASLDRPFVEFASKTGSKMKSLPGKAALDKAHSGRLRDVERVEPFIRRESQLAYGGTPVFRRQVGKLVPDLRAAGASGRIFSDRVKRDIQGVRNVKRVGGFLAGKVGWDKLDLLFRGRTSQSEH